MSPSPMISRQAPAFATAVDANAAETGDYADMPALECSACGLIHVGGVEYMTAEYGPAPWSVVLCTCSADASLA